MAQHTLQQAGALHENRLGQHCERSMRRAVCRHATQCFGEISHVVVGERRTQQRDHVYAVECPFAGLGRFVEAHGDPPQCVGEAQPVKGRFRLNEKDHRSPLERPSKSVRSLVGVDDVID